MAFKIKNRKNGFTAIEFILWGAVAAIGMIASISFWGGIDTSYVKVTTEAKQIIKAQHMRRMQRCASNINPASLGYDLSALRLWGFTTVDPVPGTDRSKATGIIWDGTVVAGEEDIMVTTAIVEAGSSAQSHLSLLPNSTTGLSVDGEGNSAMVVTITTRHKWTEDNAGHRHFIESEYSSSCYE